MIRHGRLSLAQAASVRVLAIAMIELPFGALLVASVGAPPLLPAGLLAALVAAVAVSAVAVRADEENRVAALTKANSLPQNRFAMKDWTTAVVSWQLKTSSVWFYLSNGCRTRNPAALTAGFHLFLAFEPRYFLRPLWRMIGRMIAPSAR